MREIKFRIWEQETKTMFTPASIPNPTSSPDRTGGILLQFTGLLDRNSKEIYEGDIVRFMTLSGHKMIGGCIYVCDNGGAAFYFLTPFGNLEPFKIEIYGTVSWEVIGNIYESKDLLTQF